VLLALPLAALVVFSAISAVKTWRELRAMNAAVERAAFSSAGSSLIHELQKERGLSSGFTASKGAAFAAELKEQRRETAACRVTLEEKMAISDSAIHFIKESLPALKQFYPSELNDEWIRRRYADWSGSHSGADLQLKNADEAEEYLSSFYSPYSGSIWNDDYAELVKGFLPNLSSNNIQVWNIGCGKGYETYSFACILKSRYPNGNIKIWANDSDIMAISQAPNMMFELEEMPGYCRPYMVKGRNGYSFVQAIKDSIVFEYHDILNDNPLPDLDIILVRDVLSFLSTADQARMVSGFTEKLKSRGIVFLGRNEVLSGLEWEFIGREPVSVFAHAQ
jgi:purine-binding chemotaxis protein CheW